MIVNFLGDSITYGIGASDPSKCFVSLLKEKFPDLEINNYGVSGTRIARQDELFPGIADCDSAIFNLDFNCRLETIKRGSDVIFVFGGTNDFGHGYAPFGNENDDTLYTFCGALNALVDSLLSKYDRKHIFFIAPLPRWDEDSKHGDGYGFKKEESKTLLDYRKRIEEKCAESNITYLDFTGKFTKPSTNNPSGMFADGLHPNDAGHALLAELISGIIVKIG